MQMGALDSYDVSNFKFKYLKSNYVLQKEKSSFILVHIYNYTKLTIDIYLYVKCGCQSKVFQN